MRTGASSATSAVGARRHNENDVTMTVAGLWTYGDWRHVATGCTALVRLKKQDRAKKKPKTATQNLSCDLLLASRPLVWSTSDGQTGSHSEQTSVVAGQRRRWPHLPAVWTEPRQLRISRGVLVLVDIRRRLSSAVILKH